VAADEKGMAVKQSQDAREQAERDRLQAIADKIAAAPLEFTIRTGEHKEVFGSVSKRDIEAVLRDRGITEGHVILDHPIKSTGEHRVEIDFGKGVRGVSKVFVKAV
jgi:large subunit ribosomal protein L9